MPDPLTARESARPPAARALGDLIKQQQRRSKFRRQTELAAAAACSPNVVSDLMTAARPIPWETVGRIAAALDLSDAWRNKVFSQWQTADLAWRQSADLAASEVPEPFASRVEPSAEVQGLLRAQFRSADELPYRLMTGNIPPLASLYIEQIPQFAEGGTAPTDDIGDSPLSLTAALETHRHIVITADAGGGKSTSLNRIVAQSSSWWIEGDTRRSSRPPYVSAIPVKVQAKELAAAPVSMAIANSLNKELAGYLDHLIGDEIFRSGPMRGVEWLVLVDGVDEIFDHAKRRRVIDMLAKRIGEGRGLYRFVIASRPLSTGELATLQYVGATAFQLKPFSVEQLGAFALNWCVARGHTAPDIMAESFMRTLDSVGLTSTVKLPLLATISLIVYEAGDGTRFPATRSSLYAEFFHYLLDVRQQYTETRTTLHAEIGRYRYGRELSDWLFENMELLLEEHAYANTDNEMRGASVDVGFADMVGEKSQWPTVGIPDWGTWVETLLIGTGIVRVTGYGFSYAHRSFGEYLASGEVVRRLRAHGLAGEIERQLTRLLTLDVGRNCGVFALGRWVDEGNDITAYVTRLLDGDDRNALLTPYLVAGGVIGSRALEASIIERLYEVVVRSRKYGAAALALLVSLPDRVSVVSALLRLAERNLSFHITLGVARCLHAEARHADALRLLLAVEPSSVEETVRLSYVLFDIDARECAQDLLRPLASTSDNDPAFVLMLEAFLHCDMSAIAAGITQEFRAVHDIYYTNNPRFDSVSALHMRATGDESAALDCIHGNCDWNDRIEALRILDYSMSMTDWQLFLGHWELQIPEAFWREVLVSGNSVKVGAKIREAWRDDRAALPTLNIHDIVDALKLLELTSVAEEMLFETALHERSDFDDTPTECTRLLAFMLGEAEVVRKLSVVVRSAEYEKRERVSAAISLMELEKYEMAFMWLSEASGDHDCALRLVESYRSDHSDLSSGESYFDVVRAMVQADWRERT